MSKVEQRQSDSSFEDDNTLVTNFGAFCSSLAFDLVIFCGTVFLMFFDGVAKIKSVVMRLK